MIIGPSHDYDGTNGIVAGTDTAMLKLENAQATLIAEDNIIVTSDLGNISVESSNGKVELEASQSAELKVGATNIKLEPIKITMKSVQTTVEAQAALDLKSPSTTVEGFGILNLKGAMVLLGSTGGLPVARVGDTVVSDAADPNSVIGIITSGSPTVLAR